MVNELIRSIENEFGVKVMEHPTKFLGLTIQRDVSNGRMVLHQRPYLEAVLERFGMNLLLYAHSVGICSSVGEYISRMNQP